MLRICARFTFLISALTVGFALRIFGQGTMVHPTPPSTTRDSSGNLKTDNAGIASEAAARGQVALADGSAPEGLVEIYASCGGSQKFVAVPDSKGRFNFNPGVLGDSKGCVLSAALEGYRSETKSLADVNPNSGMKLGKIVLTPLSSNTEGLTSATGTQASKSAKKAYEKGLDEAAKQAWNEAIASLQKATAAYPDYSYAWLAVGILQQSDGNRDDAQKSFAESARADAKFAVPLVFMAAVDAVKGDWQATAEHSQKSIDLNPAAFPRAYELNALGNLNLQRADAAQKSATEGLQIDSDHRYPELQYVLGMVLMAKHDREGAMQHLRAYIDEAPSGPNAPAAKTALAQLQAAH